MHTAIFVQAGLIAVSICLVPRFGGHTFYDLDNFDCRYDCICRQAACTHGMSGCSCTVPVLPCHDCDYTSSSPSIPDAIPLHIRDVFQPHNMLLRVYHVFTLSADDR